MNLFLLLIEVPGHSVDFGGGEFSVGVEAIDGGHLLQDVFFDGAVGPLELFDLRLEDLVFVVGPRRIEGNLGLFDLRLVLVDIELLAVDLHARLLDGIVDALDNCLGLLLALLVVLEFAGLLFPHGLQEIELGVDLLEIQQYLQLLVHKSRFLRFPALHVVPEEPRPVDTKKPASSGRLM